MQQQDQASPAELERARAFITRCRWTFAASVPEWPHFYCLRRWLPADAQDDFDWFESLVAEHGYPGTFWRATWLYLELGDGWKYWFSNEAFREGRIVNRARLDIGQLNMEVER